MVFDIVDLLRQSFGTTTLLLSLSLDAWRSKAKKTHWIPGDSLVLGAVSLQLVPLFYRQSAERFIIDYDIMLLNRGGRVVVCVFFGILLSDVPRSCNRNMLSDMLALSISAIAVLIHLSYEIYMLYPLSYSSATFSYKSWMLISNIIIFASIVLLALLGCAVLASKSIQELVTRRIPVLLFWTGYQNPPISGSLGSSRTVRSAVMDHDTDPPASVHHRPIGSQLFHRFHRHCLRCDFCSGITEEPLQCPERLHNPKRRIGLVVGHGYHPIMDFHLIGLGNRLL